MSAGLRPATSRQAPRTPADGRQERPRTAIAPVDYLKAHKIREKLYDLTRALAIHQPHNPADFLSASQHLVERDALRRTGGKRLPQKVTRAGSAASARARGADAGGEPTLLLVELERNAASLASLSSAILPHVDNGFAQFGPVGSHEEALDEALRNFEEEAQRALKLVQGAFARPQNTVVPHPREGDSAGRPVSALTAVAASGAATDSALRAVLNGVHRGEATGALNPNPHLPHACLSRAPELPAASECA